MVQTAHPPIEAVAFASFVTTICLAFIPNVLSTLDSIASIETLTTPRFEHVISKKALGYIRLSIALLIFFTTLHRIFLEQVQAMLTPYLKGSKLRKTPIYLHGVRSQIMFTAWSWNLLGLTFALNGIVTLLSVYDDYGEDEIIVVPTYYKILMRGAVLAFTISTPASMMVTMVTTYVLWPRSKKNNNGAAAIFKTTRALLQHNANIIASLTEVAILGRIPLRIDYVPLAVLYGSAYVFHTWNMTHRLLPSGEPQFVYFFLDTTLDKKIVVLVMVALLTALMLFHCLFAGVSVLIAYINGGILCNAVLVIGLASCICRFRD